MMLSWESQATIGTTLAGALPGPEAWNAALWTIRHQVSCHELVGSAREHRAAATPVGSDDRGLRRSQSGLGRGGDRSCGTEGIPGKVAYLVPFLLAGVMPMQYGDYVYG